MPVSIFYLSLVTRVLGVEKFGQLTIFLAVVQFFFCVFINWSRNSIIRFGSEAFAKEKNLGKIIGSQGLIMFGFFILAVLLLGIMRDYFGNILGLGKQAYLWVVLYLAAYILSDFILQFLKVRHKMRSYALAIFLRQIILLLVFSLMFFVFKFTPFVTNVIIVEIISYLSILAIFFVIAFPHKRILSSISYSNDTAKEILRYSWPVMIMMILGYSMMWTDIWMIKFFLTPSAVGEYAAANRLMQLVEGIIMPASIVGLPLVVSLRTVGADSLVHTFATKIVPQLCFFWSFVVVALLLASGKIVYFIFGENFAASGIVFQVFLLGLSFQVLSVLYTSILQAYDWTKKMAYIAGVCVVVNILLNIVLIPRWGINGAAVSKTCSLIICGLLYARSARSCIKVPKDNYIVYFFLLIPILLAISLRIFHANSIRLLVIIVVYGLTIIFIKKTKIFSKEAWLFWEKIKMPVFARSLFKKIYGVFT